MDIHDHPAPGLVSGPASAGEVRPAWRSTLVVTRSLSVRVRTPPARTGTTETRGDWLAAWSVASAGYSRYPTARCPSSAGAVGRSRSAHRENRCPIDLAQPAHLALRSRFGGGPQGRPAQVPLPPASHSAGPAGATLRTGRCLRAGSEWATAHPAPGLRRARGRRRSPDRGVLRSRARSGSRTRRGC